MKSIKHYVILYCFYSSEGDFVIKLTTSRYWLYVKELRRIKKTPDLSVLDNYSTELLHRIVHEKRILCGPFNDDGLPF